MADGKPEVHVGDVGTLYKVRVRDEDGAFDPSGATTKQIIFKMPGSVVLTKDATALQDGTDWYLTYQVAAADGANGAEFHARAGRFSMQAYLAWADGSQFHSDVQTTDEDGAVLDIKANLA